MNLRYNIDNISEISVKLYEFNIVKDKVHILMTSDIYSDMNDFFEIISSGKTLWEDAKKELILKIGRKELILSDDKILEKWNNDPNIFGRGQLIRIIKELESNDIKSIIRDIKIGKITD